MNLRKSSGLGAAVLAAAVLLTGCGGTSNSAADSTGTSDPIKIGAIASLTGGAVFPESVEAAQAVFDQVNDEGGIDGRMIEYIAEDDKGDPAVAAQAARKLVEQDNVVALVGSASSLECAVNAEFYAQNDVYSISGLGVDPGCYSSPNISPANSGPFIGITAALEYMTEELGHTKVCGFFNTFPGWGEAQDASVAAFEDSTGIEMTYYERDLQPEDDLTPYVIAAKQAGCEGVLAFGLDFQAIATMKAVKQQGADDMTWIVSSGAYTQNVADSLGADGEGLIAWAESEPFTDVESESIESFNAFLEERGVPLTAFAEGGYVAATIMVDVLKSIDGEINRESVSHALANMEPIVNDLIGDPYAFSAGGSTSQRSVKFVQIQDGAWTVLTPEWFRVE